MDLEFDKLTLKPSDLSTVHEVDERSTLTKENVHILNKQKLNKLGKSFQEDSRGLLGNKFNVEYDDDFDVDFDDDDDFDFDFDSKIREKINSQKETLKNEHASSHSNSNFKSNTRSKARLKAGSKTKIKSVVTTPLGNNVFKRTDDNKDRDSISSFSSRTPSSVKSQYSESETENSDYAADYDDLENNGFDVDLAEMFHKRQIEAKRIAQESRNEKKLQHDEKKKKKLIPRYIDTYGVEDLSLNEGFEEIDTIDPSKLFRFQKRLSSKKLNPKKSLPVMQLTTGMNGSPRKIKKYTSTLEMNLKLGDNNTESNNHLQQKEYPVFSGAELDDIDDIGDFDLTITLSDYHKLKRKSQKFDFSKYVETPSHNNYHKYDMQKIQMIPKDSTTSRLTKEGKIKLIRSLGRPKIKKVIPAHLYGEIVYDPQLKKWCGNEEDLVRFESINNYAKPQLITRKESMPQVVGNMIYDPKKLRWVSVTGKYEDDPFGDDFDTIADINANLPRSQSGILKPITNRGVSRRLVPSESSMSLADHFKNQTNCYKVTPEMYKSWKREEERWVRKVENWFPNDNDLHNYKYELKIFLNKQ